MVVMFDIIHKITNLGTKTRALLNGVAFMLSSAFILYLYGSNIALISEISKVDELVDDTKNDDFAKTTKKMDIKLTFYIFAILAVIWLVAFAFVVLYIGYAALIFLILLC